MRRRSAQDPWETVNAHRWLVVRDRYSVTLEYRELRPNADLRATMASERERRIVAGWQATQIKGNVSFIFCERGGERVCISIEYFEPGKVPQMYAKWDNH